MATLFERLEQPPPAEQTRQPEIIRLGPATATIPPVGPKTPLSEKFLAWLLNYWTEPTISLRQICRYATPHAIRDWEVAMNLAETLASRGWLIRKTGQKQRNMHVWQIIRGPKATPSQDVAEK